MPPLHNPTETVHFDPSGWTVGVAQLARYKAGQLRGSYAEHFAAVMVLTAQTEFLTQLAYAHQQGKAPQDATTEAWVWQQVCSGDKCTFGGSQAIADQVGFGPLYAATQQIVRDLVNTSRFAGPHQGLPSLPPGGVEDAPGLGIIPVAGWVAIAVVGAAAAAAVTWWGVDKNEKEAEVSKHAADVAAQLAQYQAWLDDNYRRGGGAPPPPPFIDAAAMQDRSSNMWALGAGAVLGGLAVYGISQAAKVTASRRSPKRIANPKRRRRSSSTSSTPRKKKRKAAPKKKRATKRKATKKRASVRNATPRKRTAKRKAAPKKKRATKRKTTKRKTTKKRASVRNATPRKRAAKRKAAPKKKRATKRKTTKKRATKKRAPRRAPKKRARKRNPMKRGYSRPTLTANIAELKRAGYSNAQASAIAYKAARESYRKRHPRGAFPSHLRR